MATNILSNQALTSAAVVYSSEISDINNIDIQAILSAGATGQVKYTIQRKTTNGDWRTAKDEAGQPLTFTTSGDIEDGINIIGINAAKLRVKCEILGGTGTLNIEYESV